jgi:hypothetical protein
MRFLAVSLTLAAIGCGPATPTEQAKSPPKWPELRASETEAKLIEAGSQASKKPRTVSPVEPPQTSDPTPANDPPEEGTAPAEPTEDQP